MLPLLLIIPLLAPAEPQILWTFDDGPHRQSTPHILRLLDRYCLKARFYVLGAHQLAPRNRKWLREVVARGHKLGNHLFTHTSECTLGVQGTLKELRRTEWWVAKVLKRPVRGLGYYRPPHGYRCRAVDRAIRRAGYRIQMWHVSDYRISAWKMYRMTRFRLRRGRRTILLFHHKWKKLEEFLGLMEKGGYVKRCK